MKKEINKILIIQTAFIGDVILATPLIEKLHKYFPSASIDFLVKKGNEGVLENHPYIKELLVLDKKNKLKNILSLVSKIRKTRYDYVVNLHRFASSGIITSLSGSKHTVGFDKNPFSIFFSKSFPHVIGKKENPKHEVERNLELIADITDYAIEKPRIHPDSEDWEKVRKYKMGKYICIAPTSVWFTKQLPMEKWIELIEQLPSNLIIYLLGAGSDKSTCQEIIERSKNKNIRNLAGELSLKQSAALMADAVLNYTNDSSPMHMASSMNAPVCAVYCSTIPEFGFGPLSDFSRIVQTTEQLACKPCNLHGYKACPLGHFKCAHTILTTQLLQVFDEAVKSK